MYIIDYGYIQNIEIEFISSDGTYLSDQPVAAYSNIKDT